MSQAAAAPKGSGSAAELADAVVVDFPLHGQNWVAVTSPADRIPSHGVDMLGQRYAYDFLRVDDRPGFQAHPAGRWRGLLIGGRTRECYAWGAPVHAPMDGEVVAATDGMGERGWLHPVRELAHAAYNAVTFRPSRLPRILGNHVVLRGDGVFAAFAHFAPGSVAVKAGQRVRAGDLLGRVGHTGNSTMPHLHVQLMDSDDPLSAKGVPCAFRAYEVRRDGAWTPVRDGIPGRADRIRSVAGVVSDEPPPPSTPG
jgi:murein DD-endopeptidase MepM/ murein hydrolase activator NlpD